MTENRGQVSIAMGSAVMLVLAIAITALVFSQVMSSVTLENVSNPVERSVRSAANTIGPPLLLILIAIVIVVMIFFLASSMQAFGGVK